MQQSETATCKQRATEPRRAGLRKANGAGCQGMPLTRHDGAASNSHAAGTRFPETSVASLNAAPLNLLSLFESVTPIIRWLNELVFRRSERGPASALSADGRPRTAS